MRLSIRKSFPFYAQLDQMDCGPTCIKMISAFYGRKYSIGYLRDKSYFSKNGVSFKGLMDAAEQIGLRSLSVKIPFKKSMGSSPNFFDLPFPSILFWEQKHFVIVHKATKKYIHIADPAIGKLKLDHESFQKYWLNNDEKGVALILEPTPEFYNNEEEIINKTQFTYLLKYLIPYKRLLFQFCLGLLLISSFQLIFPFLTQSIVDVGIKNQNLTFINIILMAQIMLFVGQISVEFIQNWILLHVSTRLNVSLVSDFLSKLMRLSIGFFDTKKIGDLIQRIEDHTRIEDFLTGDILNTLFSLLNFIIFGIILIYFNTSIFLVFLGASFLYLGWIFFFLKKRRDVDYQRFRALSKNQGAIIELIQGMQEIKLQNSERKRRRHWTFIQAKLFKANIKSLSISQYQDSGAKFINQLKDIIISFIAAKSVINGHMTLGTMLAVQYIVGQLNAPLQRVVQFIRAGQDAKISLERLGEIHHHENEQDLQYMSTEIPEKGDIKIENLSFQYNPTSPVVLEDINLVIPRGKVTAIVGTSGSGKTTLMKLLLGFYNPVKGRIQIGITPFDQLDKTVWRGNCGAVMQDGYIFSDTIANNIAESDESVDTEKLIHAVETANIRAFIESLPVAYNTLIGPNGVGLSRGQKQRLLIARAIYKQPDFFFFDEATNSLDAKNEKVIVNNLDQVYKSKTVIVIAHRLSTVKNADQIVVLDNGVITERGNHQELTALKGAYYKLVKDQLEL